MSVVDGKLFKNLAVEFTIPSFDTARFNRDTAILEDLFEYAVFSTDRPRVLD